MQYLICHELNDIKDFSRQIERIFVSSIDSPIMKSMVPIHPSEHSPLVRNCVLITPKSIDDFKKDYGNKLIFFYAEDNLISMLEGLVEIKPNIFEYKGNYVLRDVKYSCYKISFYPDFKIELLSKIENFKKQEAPKKQEAAKKPEVKKVVKKPQKKK